MCRWLICCRFRKRSSRWLQSFLLRFGAAQRSTDNLEEVSSPFDRSLLKKSQQQSVFVTPI